MLSFQVQLSSRTRSYGSTAMRDIHAALCVQPCAIRASWRKTRRYYCLCTGIAHHNPRPCTLPESSAVCLAMRCMFSNMQDACNLMSPLEDRPKQIRQWRCPLLAGVPMKGIPVSQGEDGTDSPLLGPRVEASQCKKELRHRSMFWVPLRTAAEPQRPCVPHWIE